MKLDYCNLPEHQALLKHHAQCAAEYRAWRSPFIVRAALMFNVPVGEVTLAMYSAAVERTQQDTMPPGVGVVDSPSATPAQNGDRR